MERLLRKRSKALRAGECRNEGGGKKRLLITASTFPRWEGDTEPRFILDLAEALTEYFEVSVLAPACPGAKEREDIRGVRVIRYHYFPVHRWETLCYPGAIVPRIKEKRSRALQVPFLLGGLFISLCRLLPSYDAVHANWLIPQGIVQACFRKPYAVTGHGGDVTSLNGRLIRKLKLLCLKRASCITAVSGHLEAELKKLYPDGHIEVLPMGCRVKNLGKEHRMEEYFGQCGRKVVLFVGRLAEKKGVAYLIEAMKQVDALLIIVGDGPLREGLERKARELGGRVRFLGAKGYEELKVIYASADLFAAPSVRAGDGDMEGTPTAILEAMASCLPVVASRSGGIGELIEDGVTGLLCEEKNPEDIACKLNRLLADAALRGKLSRRARAKAEEYDYALVAQKYGECIMRGIEHAL